MSHFDTIVIGAGVAGLTAARLLAREGQSVVVLEARDRSGGRVFTDRSEGDVTDLGASWIHGIEASPVAAAAAAFGMPMREFTVGGYQPDSRPIAYYDPAGKRLSPHDAGRYVSDIRAVDRLLPGLIADAAEDASYRDVTDAALAAQHWDSARTERVREYFQHRTEEQYGVWISDLAAHGLDDDTVNGEEVIFPDGYDRLPQALSVGVDIRLGHVVTRVTWSDTGAMVTAGGVEFTARAAVVTVPVGVLTSSSFVIDPPMPSVNSEALARLRMNNFEKVVLRFEHQFWDRDVYAIRQQGPEATWWHSWYDLTRLDGNPTLLTFAAGPAARAIRGWTPDAVAKSTLQQLERLYPRRVEPPTRVQVTAWQDDPFSRGSYAFMVVGATTADHDLLATPIGNVLHLAGEATWTDDPATVPGALYSGHRAASRILGYKVAINNIWASH